LSIPEGSEPVVGAAEGMKSETLMIYGFSFEYPGQAKLEFNPKFKREGGDVAIKLTGEYNTFVSWGNLEKIREKFSDVNKHAIYSIENVRKSSQGKVTNIENRDVTVNGHTAAYNHVRIDVPRRGLFGGRSQSQEIHSLHIHCPESGRYFVIYGSAIPERSEPQGRTVMKLLESFRCH
jgi:hypothetical protein